MAGNEVVGEELEWNYTCSMGRNGHNSLLWQSQGMKVWVVVIRLFGCERHCFG